MNAEKPNMTPTVPPTSAGPPPALAHHQKTGPLIDPDNSLVRWLKSTYATIKSGKFIHPKILAVILLVVLCIGVWWWFSAQSAKSRSARWLAYGTSNNPDEWDKLASENKDNITGILARLAKARDLAGPQGAVKLMNDRKLAERTKAIGNIETARAEFIKLADEFKKDPTLRAECLIEAADAELLLVGWRKEGASPTSDDPGSYRGTVQKAVELYRQAAETVGVKSAIGEKLVQRANTLESNSAEVLSVQRSLYDHFIHTWAPIETPLPGGSPSGLPPIVTPKPPGVLTPKAPDNLPPGDPLPKPVLPVPPKDGVVPKDGVPPPVVPPVPVPPKDGKDTVPPPVVPPVPVPPKDAPKTPDKPMTEPAPKK